jgi:alpha-tubulin suppressor-like RCC1 family protein
MKPSMRVGSEALVSLVLLVLLSAMTACTRTGEILRAGDDTVVLHQSAVRLSTGQGHTCAVKGGEMACWGDAGNGRLGVPDTSTGQGLGPVALPGSLWIAPAAGGSHSCGLTTDGAISCWGANGAGQLGTGDLVPSEIPRQVSLPMQAVDVRTGFDVTCALLTDASVWCWGANLEGQLGQDDTYPGTDSPVPLRVGSENDWTAVSPGQGHACGLRAPGRLYCWGRNSTFELGQGNTEPQELRLPTQVGTNSDWVEVTCGQDISCARKRDGTAWCWGTMVSGALAAGDVAPHGTPTRVPVGDDWTQLSSGTFHTCGLRAGGTLSCAGRNTEGQIGLPSLADANPGIASADPGTNWVEVHTGRFFTCARKADDAIYCMGTNRGHELAADPMVTFSSVMLRAR